jgi:hypothetical protein
MWEAAEDYYSNTLREAKFQFAGEKEAEPEIDDAEEIKLLAAEGPKTPPSKPVGPATTH